MIDPRDLRAEDGFVAGVREAAAAMRALFEPTPLQRNDYLSGRFGGEVWLKREDLTPVRSYKIRGAFNAMRKALEARPDRRRFVCASAGNHAQGLAYACRHFGAEGVVFMPVTTPQQKIDKTRQFGGGCVEIRLKATISTRRSPPRRPSPPRPAAVPPAVRRCGRDRGPGDVASRGIRAAAGDRIPSWSRSAAAGSRSGWCRWPRALAPAARRSRLVEPVGGRRASGGRSRPAGPSPSPRSTASSTARPSPGSAT